MERIDGFVAAPNEPGFFNPVPSGGFKLVKTGEQIPLSAVLPMSSDPGSEEITVTAVPRPPSPGGSRPLLLLPQGPYQEAKNVYHRAFDEDYKPLFQRFAGLEDEGEILEFANIFGQLRQEARTDLTEGRGKTYLEPLSFWESEIETMRSLLAAWGAYEVDKDIDSWVRFRHGRVFFGTFKGSLPIVTSESKRETLFRCIAIFIDEKLKDCPLIVSHGWGTGIVRSYLEPLSLQGALWLQLSQAFFNDGPKEEVVRRDVLTGDYYRERDANGKKVMRKKTTGPYKGHCYHRDIADRFYEQKRKRDRAAEEGRVVKESRRGRTEFLVGFDEFSDEKRRKGKGNKK